jgi:glutamate--cysteine ligase
MLKSNGENLALTDWATKLLDAMQPFAELLDAQQSDDSYQTALAAQRLTVDDVSLTPSAQVLNNMKAQNRSWLELGNQLSTAHKQTLLRNKTNMEALADLKKEQKNSLRQELKIKQQDTMDFSDFLAAYQAS